MASSEPSKSALYLLQFTACVAAIFLNTPGCCQSHFGPPYVDAQEREIKAGKSLHLTCSGEFELSWNTPNSTGIAERTVILSYPNSNDIRHFSSSLEVKDTIYTDTGSYSCYYKSAQGKSDVNNERYNTSIYLFVSDETHLLLPMEKFRYVTVTLNAELKIPCRPTSIDVTVELYKGTDENGKKMDNPEELMFDPEQGFTVFSATVDYASQFTCIARLSENIEKFTMQIFVITGTTSPPSPYINNTLAKDVVEGKTFFLSCQVRAGKSVVMFMEWSYPNKGDERIVEGKEYTVEKQGETYRNTLLNLTVYNSLSSDEGTYKCTATDHTGKSSSRTTSVIIYRPSEEFIELQPQGFEKDQTMEYSLGDHVTLSVKVNSFPKAVLHWFKGDEIVSDNHHSTNQLGDHNILTIQKLVRNDTSNYTLRGTAGNETDSVTVEIIVTEIPTVHLNSTKKRPVPEVFLPGSKFSLVCRAEGCPLADVEWQWTNCTDVSVTDSCLNDVIVPRNPSENNETSSQYYVMKNGCVRTSFLHGVANMQGSYRCLAVNEIGSAWKVAPIVFNDYAEKIIFHTSSSMIYEQDDLNLTCAVSLYYYSQLRLSFRNGVDSSRIHNTVSTYTNRSVLHLSPILGPDSGNYVCEALHRDTLVWEKRSKDVKVHKIVAPTIYKTNMNNTNYTLQKEANFELYCHVNGTPIPMVQWFRNGVVIQYGNDSAMYISNSSLIIPRVVLRDSGKYACITSNRAGTLIFNATLTVEEITQGGGLKTFAIVIIVVVIVLVAILLFLLVVFGKRCYLDRKNKMEIKAFQKMLFIKGEMGIYNPNIPLEDQVDCLPYDQRWEFPMEKLKLGRMIGQGAFGRVVKAVATGIIPQEETTVVAVKMLKEQADMEQRKSLMQELKIMIHIGQHVNVVNLLGAVTQNLHKGEFYVIVEYCRFGNLRNYIYLHRDTFFNQINYMTDQIEIDKRASDIFMNTSGSRELEQILINKQTSDGSVSGCLLYPNSLYAGQLVDRGTPGCTLYPNSLYIPLEGNSVSTTDGTTQVVSDGTQYQTGASDRTSGFSSTMKKFRTSRILTTSDLVCYAFQIACGMEYLSSKKLVHRDLALRNILLTEDNILKICDFGLAKDCYMKNYYRKKSDGRLPIKWMAVESLRDKVFSVESDVWSFGVVMWELFTLGSSPYPGLDANEEFYKKLLNGSRMEKPEYSTENLYFMMLECWKHEPKLRPNFTDLRERLAELMDEDEVQHFYNMNKHFKINRVAPDYMLMGALEENAETGEHDYVNQDLSTTDAEGYLVASPLPQALNGKNTNPFADAHELKPMLRSEYGVGNGYFDMGKSSILNEKRKSSEC